MEQGSWSKVRLQSDSHEAGYKSNDSGGNSKADAIIWMHR